MQVFPYSTKHADLWDAFVADCPMATFLHSRKFLSHHGDKFQDRSLLFFDERDKLCGVLPAAEYEKKIVSHIGATFGGFCHKRNLSVNKIIKILDTAVQYYKQQQFNQLIYKSVPHIYHQSPTESDKAALLDKTACLENCQLSVAINLLFREKISQLRQREYKKAVKNNIRISDNLQYLSDAHNIIVENLQKKHNATPTHDIKTLQLLFSLFPNEIKLKAALHNENVVAVLVLFLSKTVCHTQYIAANEQGKQLGALDYVMEYTIQESKKNNFRFFDFGVCNEPSDGSLNIGLYDFKRGFGGGGIIYESYTLNF